MIFFIVRIDWIYKIFYKNKLTKRNWINLTHHIGISPLFYYLYKNHTNTYIKKILQILGIIIIITHFILFVIKKISKCKKTYHKLIIFSAINTLFRAAPRSNWSPHTNNSQPLSS